MKTIKVRRTVVAEILDKIRQDLADGKSAKEIEARLAEHKEWVDGTHASGAYGLRDAPRIEPLQICEHEAHTDNCWSCAPRWGYTGAKVVCT